MYKMFNNHIIEVNRGDTFTIDLQINLGSPVFPEFYSLEEGDNVYFGLMEPHQPFEVALVRKAFNQDNQDDDNVLHMDFKPTDTEFLLPGRYYYSVKLVKANGDVFTVMPKTKFTIFD